MEGMRKARLAALPALTMCLAAIAAGCGDESSGDDAGSGGDDTATTELTKAEYLRKANAGCVKGRAELEEKAARFLKLSPDKKPDPVLYGDLAHLVLLPAVENEMEAVRALGTPPGPPGEERRINRLLYAEEAVLNNLAVTERLPSREYVEQKFERSAELLRDYGLTACANGIRQSREEREGP